MAVGATAYLMLRRLLGYSARSACVGSIIAARVAGTALATNAAKESDRSAATNARGSLESSLKRKACAAVSRYQAASVPILNPAATSSSAFRRTIPTTRFDTCSAGAIPKSKVATEMREGFLLIGDPLKPAGKLSILTSTLHPAHVTLMDVDGDGLQDFLVADLGEFFPDDHHKGAVIWLRGLPNGKFGTFWLDGWPRVADVEAADFNGERKNDLAVAAFGFHTTGQIAVLENQTTHPLQPAFATHTIDQRAGAIHVIPVDLNNDGHMDFVALLAQEHETVIAYINTGKKDFTFDRKIIYAAPPSISAASARCTPGVWASVCCWTSAMSTATAPSTSWWATSRSIER